MTQTLELATLAAARDTVLPALRRVADRLSPEMRVVVGYHQGWLDEHGHEIDAGAGKALRPALALLSANAVGAPVECGIHAAVAVELVHDFSLLHDDLMDGDTERRHRPAAWTVFGSSAAILAGNALLAAALQVLLEHDDKYGPEAAWLEGAGTVAVTAGASAPPSLVTAVVERLREFGPVEVEERVVATESVRFQLPKEVRQP